MNGGGRAEMEGQRSSRLIHGKKVSQSHFCWPHHPLHSREITRNLFLRSLLLIKRVNSKVLFVFGACHLKALHPCCEMVFCFPFLFRLLLLLLFHPPGDQLRARPHTFLHKTLCYSRLTSLSSAFFFSYGFFIHFPLCCSS